MNDKTLVLLVEDSATQAREIAANIRKNGFDVMIAEDGVTALNLVDENKPQLIVLDVNLPGDMDGFQICRRLKRDPNTRHIPVIMLTVADSSESTLAGIEAGADDYIAKDIFAAENLIATFAALNITPSEGNS
jgi:two-component system cell cycle response regulator